MIAVADIAITLLLFGLLGSIVTNFIMWKERNTNKEFQRALLDDQERQDENVELLVNAYNANTMNKVQLKRKSPLR